MSHKRGLTRRRFATLAGAGALAAGGPAFLFPDRARAAGRTLKIIQWSHFVPAWDTWFNGTYVKEWGQKNDTEVIVDNINLVDLPARAASEVSAKKGHDLFMFLSPPASYEPQVIDMTHVYRRSRRSTARRSTSPTSPRSIRRPRSTSPSPTPTRPTRETGTRTGGPKPATRRDPTTYDDLLKGARKIRDATGHPVRPRSRPGARHVHGGARHPLVLRRRGTGRGRQRHDQLETDDRRPEVRQGPLPADRDARGLHLDASLEQPGDARRPRQLRHERDLDHAAVGAREAADRLEDHDQPGAQGPGAPHRGRARHELLRHLGVRREQGRRAEVPDRLDRPLPGRFRRRAVLQFPVLPLDGSGPPEAHRDRRPGQSAGQVQGARQRPRLGDERGLPGLRDGGHLRGLQHVGHSHDVRQGRAGRRDARRMPRRRRRRSTSASSPGGSRLVSDSQRAGRGPADERGNAAPLALPVHVRAATDRRRGS